MSLDVLLKQTIPTKAPLFLAFIFDFYELFFLQNKVLVNFLPE